MSWRSRVARGLSTVLDPTIALSYDRTGFRRHSASFDPADLQIDLTGRQILITGANSGIGLATAEVLAGMGASVWMLCRSMERGQAALAAVREKTGGDVTLEQVDLSSVASIDAFCERLPLKRIDVLIHNAGVLPTSHQRTEAGHELTLATNLIGPYVLTRRLQERISSSDDGRIIFVSSGGMYTQKLRVDELEAPERGFDGVVAYARTKRAMVVLSEILAEELPGIGVHCMHPGWASTPGVKTSIPTFHRVTSKILRTPAEGADTVVWLAASARIQGRSGLFWFDRAPRRTHYTPLTRESLTERERLMAALNRWTGIR